MKQPWNSPCAISAKKKYSDCFCYIQAFISRRSSVWFPFAIYISSSYLLFPGAFITSTLLKWSTPSLHPSLPPPSPRSRVILSEEKRLPGGKSDWSWIRVRELISPCLLLCSQRGSAHQWKHSTFWQGHASSPEDDLIHLFLRLLRLLRIASDPTLFAPPTSHSQWSHILCSAHLALPVISNYLLRPLHIPNYHTMPALLISPCQWSHIVYSTPFTFPTITHCLLHPLHIPRNPILMDLPNLPCHCSHIVCSTYFPFPTISPCLLRPLHIANKLVLIAQPTLHYQQSHLVCSSHFTMPANSYWLLHPHYITNDIPLFASLMIHFVTDIESLRFPQMWHMMNRFVFRFYINKRFDLDLELICFHKSIRGACKKWHHL